MVAYLLMAAMGLMMFLGARCLDRALARSGFAGAETIAAAVFVAKSAGMMISLAGFGASAWAACS